MEHTGCAAILDAIEKTGIYVLDQADHSVLYLNKRAREASPGAKPGTPCLKKQSGSCGGCPLLAVGDRSESRSAGYSALYGGTVDTAVSRILWEDGTPAFLIAVTPRADAAGETCRVILRADLEQDRCAVLLAGQASRPYEEIPLSQALLYFAGSDAVHPEDAGRFAGFTRPEHLRRVTRSGQAMIYRRQTEGGYRWNLMEAAPAAEDGGRFVLLRIKDVHDALREGLEGSWKGLTTRGQALIQSLGESCFHIYAVDTNTGAANPIRVDGIIQESLEARPWDELMHSQITSRLHQAYLDEFASQFSLEGLRRSRDAGRRKAELLCRCRRGESFRYTFATAYFGEEAENSSCTIVALQDVDERVQRELAHTKRDAQMAAILRSRYQMTFRATLSLDRLRQKAEMVEDSSEEICRYRIRGEHVRWIELHILYSRQNNHVMVNILGQDITREKQEEEVRLRTLEDRAYMITSLSSLFFSTYYIDLERDTFRAVTQQHRVTDVLGDEVNFTTALQLYANHFIHPDDREKYLRAMSVSHLREALRWWQPYVAVEYRKLPDFPELGDRCQLVRATAVMAQTGTDDMPKTVVYVARDITEKAPEQVRKL
ncbi:MAG: hypothetical protein HFF71_07120 [Oscillospiraceae bacterium]|nr:hypothetical protein [Oscillospiraceae bacterium]